MSHFFSGVTTALITPFKNGEIDFASLKKLITFQLDNKIKGFVVSGSTAEAATLHIDEKKQILDFVLSEVAGHVPVIVGSGTNNTEESSLLTEFFNTTSVSGFLVVTPYYNKPPQRGLIEHFTQIAGRTTKPVIVYNVPSRTVVKLEVPTVKALTKIKNIVGIKEASGDLKVIGQFIKSMPKTFSILSGDDETFLPAIQKGAHGVVSVISHVVPTLCVNAEKKNLKKIKDISKIVFSEANPIPVKWILKEMGIIESAELRLPLVSFDSKLHFKAKKDLKKLGVL